MNADNPNYSTAIDNNDLKSQHHTVEGIDFSIVLSGESTNGEYTLLEAEFPADSQSEIPSHIHRKEILIVYIIEGNFSFKYGKEVISGSSGMVFKFEKGIAHSYKKIGTKKGRLLLLYVPSGFENFFRELNQTHIDNLRKHGLEDPIMVQLLEKNYGVRMLLYD
ncbi:MAG: cupin domain-containing protein [Candidatus Nitrosocosmicus sp.]